MYISTHAPHARCDTVTASLLCGISDFYSRTPCEVRHTDMGVIFAFSAFLLTHPMRGATCCIYYTAYLVTFLLTHPMRGATCRSVTAGAGGRISTHAPHARCDIVAILSEIAKQNFYSRTPCEVRHLIHTKLKKTFNKSPSVRTV